MPSETTAQVQNTVPRGTGRRGGNRGRGGNFRGRNVRANTNGNRGPETHAPPTKDDVAAVAKNGEAAPADEEKDEVAVCWICAEPVKYYSVSGCNHRTCHVCSLRLRALYKKTDCTFCKDPQPSVIFTTSPDALYVSFTLESMGFKDSKLSIYFETQEIMEETLILLRFNCPDPDCDYIGNGWGDLKLHVRATHGKLMCELCIRSKKVFAHEHALYPPNLLPIHLPSIHTRHHKTTVPKDQIEGGVHPLCEFCRECFFSDDELYGHMRERHEECFICKRNEVRDQYFQNYESLERHFNNAHHPCNQPQCLVRKFVVFNTPLDLKAHMVDEHGADMTSRDKKDARRIQAEFEFEEVGIGGRRGGRGRDREQPLTQQHQHYQQPQQPPPPPAPSRPPGNGRRREFGASLTVEGGANSSPNNGNTPEQSRRATPSPPLGEVDPGVAERHAAFLTRLHSLSSNPTTAVPVVKAAIRGYMSSEASARDLISTVWNVLDRSLEHTASIVNAFVDLIDEEDKKQDLLSSWKGFAIEQRRQFPDLVPSAIGSGYAAITTGRVLNAKNSSAARSSQQSSRQVWDRVAQAASSSAPHQPPAKKPTDRFPALQAPTPVSGSTPTPSNPPFRQGQRNTPWSASSSSGFRPPASSSSNTQSFPSPFDARPVSVPGAGASQRQGPPPKLSNSLFPELPTSSTTRQKAAVSGNVSLKNILGAANAPPAVPAWQPQSGANGMVAAAAAGNGTDEPAGEGEGDHSAPGPGKGKKGKGKQKQKQTLFTLGTFPS